MGCDDQNPMGRQEAFQLRRTISRRGVAEDERELRRRTRPGGIKGCQLDASLRMGEAKQIGEGFHKHGL